MFGAKKTDGNSGGNTPSVSSISNNLITSGTRIEGSITANSDMRIDGELYGNLSCMGKIIIGAEGKIIGDIDCQNAVIEGVFQGKLRCAELLNIRETAQINGEISTDKLMVQAGAIFNVVCNMGSLMKMGTATSKDKALAS
ncbi:MAG: polymer-forming cytoskeletal protein [Saprospiraceae bacterium]|nr:polymer-forming cytoskeletal protein [Saprospiraceae bacterium]